MAVNVSLTGANGERLTGGERIYRAIYLWGRDHQELINTV